MAPYGNEEYFVERRLQYQCTEIQKTLQRDDQFSSEANEFKRLPSRGSDENHIVTALIFFIRRYIAKRHCVTVSEGVQLGLTNFKFESADPLTTVNRYFYEGSGAFGVYNNKPNNNGEPNNYCNRMN